MHPRSLNIMFPPAQEEKQLDEGTIWALLWSCGPSLSSCCPRWSTWRAAGREVAAFIFQSPMGLQIKAAEIQSSYCPVWGSEWGASKSKGFYLSSPVLLFWRAGQISNPGNIDSRSRCVMKCNHQPFLVWNANPGLKHIKYLFCFSVSWYFLSYCSPSPHTDCDPLLDVKLVKRISSSDS